MLIAKELPRIFLYKTKEQETRLSDPEPKFSPMAVMNFYANTFTELVTANIEGPVIKDDEVQYRFVSTLGTKG
ncbi:MAG: PRTRC system protein C [Candidatus Pedobacter colombiensis]|uniref:PRTRC system protein C n=1 Tax=Candidatus Pedobacter colombiensis TaxID=3121371 RepID=A0AAJ5W4E4_9SPHI|nr:PRTRC system protein C [Pedobacter sp.]WEK17946.1 MAG: PRTRC system protein C [Pedobacter sp.]